MRGVTCQKWSLVFTWSLFFPVSGSELFSPFFVFTPLMNAPSYGKKSCIMFYVGHFKDKLLSITFTILNSKNHEIPLQR